MEYLVTASLILSIVALVIGVCKKAPKPNGEQNNSWAFRSDMDISRQIEVCQARRGHIITVSYANPDIVGFRCIGCGLSWNTEKAHLTEIEKAILARLKID